MKNKKILSVFFITSTLPVLAIAQDNKNISDFLVEISSGNVSAGSIAGASKTSITKIETSQDLVMAIQPFTSGDQKSGFGLSITPARTTLTPMSIESYSSNPLMRALGSTTISYAQNTSTISSSSYKKSAISLDFSYYFDKNDDPILIANKGFTTCKSENLTKLEDAKNELVRKYPTNSPDFDKEFAKITEQMSGELKACIDSRLKSAKWNSNRIDFSVGSGWIKPENGSGTTTLLGTSLTTNAQFYAGVQSAVTVSIRGSRNALDLGTLNSTRSTSNSTLIAARYTYGSTNNGNTKILAEISSARNASQAANKDNFIYALGVDQKVFSGGWIEFRIGKNKSIENGNLQTTALLSLNITPSQTLFSQK